MTPKSESIFTNGILLKFRFSNRICFESLVCAELWSDLGEVVAKLAIRALSILGMQFDAVLDRPEKFADVSIEFEMSASWSYLHPMWAKKG